MDDCEFKYSQQNKISSFRNDKMMITRIIMMKSKLMEHSHESKGQVK